MDKNIKITKNPRFNHDFRPMRSNRTKCDICGRSAGTPSHKR